MEAWLDATATCDVPGVIRVLNAKGFKPVEIDSQSIVVVNGYQRLPQVLYVVFADDRSEIHDEKIFRRPSISDETVVKAE